MEPISEGRAAWLIKQEAQAAVNMALRRLKEEFPDCGYEAVSDFAQMDSDKFGAFVDYVGLGLDYADAYALTHRAELIERAVQAAQAEAVRSAQSRAHLTRSGGAGESDLETVPESTMETYRAWFPAWSTARIRASYTDMKLAGERSDVK
ncbi:MAG: hypothetical protein IJP30_04275 [Clostridia bacterium]|nr:hypothetical protein [Clostridia bacterium]